jgi:hypothetical protein
VHAQHELHDRVIVPHVRRAKAQCLWKMSERLSNVFWWAIAVPMLILGTMVISVIAALSLLVSSMMVRQVWVSEAPFAEIFQDIALASTAVLLILTNRRVTRLQKQIQQRLLSTDSAEWTLFRLNRALISPRLRQPH